MNRRGFLKATAFSATAYVVSKTLPEARAEAGKEAARTAVVFDPVYKQHDTGAQHPESPRRCDAIMRALRTDDLKRRTVELKPRRAEDADILRCHTKNYLATVKREIASGARQLSTGDTAVGPKSLDAALFAAGGVVAAIDLVVESKAPNAFCVVRPPGHHAAPAKGMGFCVFNNAGVGARYAQKKHKIGKVLIVDWDVHHGNGTQDIFYEDGSVFYFSTHQWPWYPGTGRADDVGSGEGKGTTLNCPFGAGAGGKEIIGAFENNLVPAMKAFKPELVLISAGFDSRIDDPLGQFRLTDEDFQTLTTIMMNIAREHAKGRVVSVLEGGYNLEGLAKASAAHVKTLSGA